MWSGLTVSLLGDGIYYVALAWQVYDISNVPTALSIVSVAWSLPMLVFIPLGGVLSDRMDRRYVLIASDAIRLVAIGGMGVLSVTGAIELRHVIGLAVLYGIGQSLFGPAIGSIVPDIVPQHLLVQANALDNFVRPAAERLAGPALGGFLIAAAGGDAGPALLIDAATFGFSAVAVALMTTRPSHLEDRERLSALKEIGEGLRFVRAHPWLWGTLLSAAVSLVFILGPIEVLVPFIIRNKLEAGADALGLVYAAGGVGAIGAALVMGQRSLPSRHILFMYSCWGVGVALIAPYAWITEIWHGMVLEFTMWALFTSGLIVWTTLMHSLVPTALLGRVTSLDWFVSLSLIPISFALTGPLAGWVGAETVFVAGGILGSIGTFAFLLVPGIRDTEKSALVSGGSDDVP